MTIGIVCRANNLTFESENVHNANDLIKCQNCGVEFKSAVTGAVSAIGVIEECPSCHKSVNTPMLIGGGARQGSCRLSHATLS